MNYEQWINGNDCCCNGGYSSITPDCDKDCSCEAIYLELSNVKTDVNVISGEVDNKLDISAYTPVDLSEYYTKDEVDELIPTVPTNVSDFVNDAGYLTEHQPLKTINGQVVSGTGNIVIEASGGSVTVDDHIDSASTNPVENKAIYGALNGKLDASAYTPTDLSNYYNKQQVDALIPTVPTSNSAFTNDMHYVTSAQTANYVTSENVETQITNHFWCGTQSEYNALAVKQPNVLYLIHE